MTRFGDGEAGIAGSEYLIHLEATLKVASRNVRIQI
jgi:hypothetical protein